MENNAYGSTTMHPFVPVRVCDSPVSRRDIMLDQGSNQSFHFQEPCSSSVSNNVKSFKAILNEKVSNNKQMNKLSEKERKRHATAIVAKFLASRGVQLSILENQPSDDVTQSLALESSENQHQDNRLNCTSSGKFSSRLHNSDNNQRREVITTQSQSHQQDESNSFAFNENDSDGNTENICQPFVKPVNPIYRSSTLTSYKGVRLRKQMKGRRHINNYLCHICSKNFQTIVDLNLHTISHLPKSLQPKTVDCSSKRINELEAQKNSLNNMKAAQTLKFALPLVDLKRPEAVGALSDLGVKYYIPLSQVSNTVKDALGISTQFMGKKDSAHNDSNSIDD